MISYSALRLLSLSKINHRSDVSYFFNTDGTGMSLLTIIANRMNTDGFFMIKTHFNLKFIDFSYWDFRKCCFICVYPVRDDCK
jgi:hypothetical protein